MDISAIVSALIAAVTPIVIGSMRDPVSKAFENRTKRLQYWKAFFELAPLADASVHDEVKELCRQELAEAHDETRRLTNRFVGELAVWLTLTLMILTVSAILLFTGDAINEMRRTGAPATLCNYFRICSLAHSFGRLDWWFWGRWKVREGL